MVHKILMVVILFVLPISFLSSQGLNLYNVLGWNYGGSWGTTDFDKTGMRPEIGPTSEDSVMRINSYGLTYQIGEEYVLQNSFGKFKLKEIDYKWPDYVLIDVKVLNTKNIWFIGITVSMLDTTPNSSLLGSVCGPVQFKNDWQTIKMPSPPFPDGRVCMVGMDIPIYSVDSGYVGIELQVNNLRFVYSNGDTILIDPFQIEWPKPVGIFEEKQTPSDFALSQNYPNPFNPSTQIKFTVPVSGQVSLVVYNSLGQEVKNLVSEEKSAGNYEVSFDASNLPSGIYFYKLQAGSFIEIKKMILLK